MEKPKPGEIKIDHKSEEYPENFKDMNVSQKISIVSAALFLLYLLYCFLSVIFGVIIEISNIAPHCEDGFFLSKDKCIKIENKIDYATVKGEYRNVNGDIVSGSVTFAFKRLEIITVNSEDEIPKGEGYIYFKGDISITCGDLINDFEFRENILVGKNDILRMSLDLDKKTGKGIHDLIFLENEYDNYKRSLNIENPELNSSFKQYLFSRYISTRGPPPGITEKIYIKGTIKEYNGPDQYNISKLNTSIIDLDSNVTHEIKETGKRTFIERIEAGNKASHPTHIFNPEIIRPKRIR